MGLKQSLSIKAAAVAVLAGCVDGDDGMAAVAPESPVQTAGAVDSGDGMAAVAPEPPVSGMVPRDLTPRQQAMRDTPTAEAAEIVATADRAFGCSVAPGQRGAFNALLRKTAVTALGIAPAEESGLYVDLNLLTGRGEVALLDGGRLVLDPDGTRRFDCAL